MGWAHPHRPNPAAERARLVDGHERRYRIALAAEALIAADDEVAAVEQAWNEPRPRLLNATAPVAVAPDGRFIDAGAPDRTQDEIEALSQRQRDADKAQVAARAALRREVNR